MKNSRVVFILVGVFLMWCALILRAAQLQILPDSRLAELQKRTYRTLVELPSRRGTIYDRNGKELAVTIPTFSMYADPKIIKGQRGFAKRLAKVMGWSPLFVVEKIKNRDRRFVWLKRNMNKKEADKVKALKLEGLSFVEESQRVYPNDNLLSQVMGFVGQDGKGLEGAERKFDSVLRGESRQMRVERDARGRPLLVDGRLFSEPPSGADIELTIDSELQFVLEKNLEEAVAVHMADSAIGVVLDAQTSEVLALGYAPTFDGNHPGEVNADTWRNRGLTDAFEPGSTMKTILLAGAIKYDGLKPSSTFFCENGKFKVGPFFIHEADAKHAFGNLTATEILGHSSNIGAAKIGLHMGQDNVYRTLKEFGLGEKTGMDLPGESRGILQPLPWKNHLLANVSFGHGVAVTPIQIANAYAAIANGGVLKQPYIVKTIRANEGAEAQDFKPKEIRRVLTPEQAAVMRMMLVQATGENSTGAPARVAGFPVGGKTGTAQKAASTGGYGKNQYISSFAGFIPATNPKYVIYVAIDNPRNKYYGNEVAAPIFSKVAGYAIRKSGLSPILISAKNVIRDNSANIKQEDAIERIRSFANVMNSNDQNKTPNLKGLTLREVYDRIRGTDIRVRVTGSGRVAKTSPEPGTELPSSKSISVNLE